MILQNVFSKCSPGKFPNFVDLNFYTCFDLIYISKYAPDCITENPSFKFLGSLPRPPPDPPSGLRATPLDFESRGKINFGGN